jgi:hypothetical protein
MAVSTASPLTLPRMASAMIAAPSKMQVAMSAAGFKRDPMIFLRENH